MVRARLLGTGGPVHRRRLSAAGSIGTRAARTLAERRGALNIVFAVVIIAVAIYMLVRNLSLS